MLYFCLTAVSVGASCYTLVAISLERYFAILHPLTSRRWQTLSHARKMILVIWLTTLLVMSPIAAFQQLLTLKNGKKACREIWPSGMSEISLDKAYSVLLVLLLLLVPLLLMSIFYGIVAKKLWVDIGKPSNYESSRKVQNGACTKLRGRSSSQVGERNILVVRQVNFAKELINRKRVIRMLFVVVVQYFICWSPVYVVNTWKTIDYPSLHDLMSTTTWSLILLLAYTSSFVHPITYCFMNKSFRRAFVRLFCCSPEEVKIIYRSKPSTSGTYVQEKY
ncbi:hypothetical protein CHS0354_003100 [Potamilus streckersoni]|uniref:G-protein coupled receptors family 1 profile domain-containing protein n=1 Tax=Potamilus streckersoni TaxID=2493646 RepID=A0AAE0RNX0_9BIVA|nr:hypothetical protein CHS0354_003100 [Potamilus streckersoni]